MTNFTASGHQLVTRQRNGKDGRSVSKVDVVYQRSTSATSVPTTWVTTAPKLPKGYYLWSATKVTYKEADGKTTTEVIGAQCIASADNLKTTVERYAQTTSRTTPPDNSSSAWQEGDTSGVQAKDGYYTWTQTKIVWQDGTITYTTPICITGDKGNTGKDGSDGAAGNGSRIRYALSKYPTSTNNHTPPADLTRPKYWTSDGYIGIYSKDSASDENKTYNGTKYDDGWLMWQLAMPTPTNDEPYVWALSYILKESTSEYLVPTPDNNTFTYARVNGTDGKDGKDGTDGADGNGILSVTSLFAISQKKNITSYYDISGWSETFQMPTADKPYVWKCLKTVYTKSSTTYSTPELIAVYSPGVNPNLLRNASFISLDRMSAWQYQGGTIVGNGHNGRNYYHTVFSMRKSESEYKDTLLQTLYKSWDVERIKPSKWYTLSYWSKQGAEDMVFFTTFSDYGNSDTRKDLYLFAGHTYTLYVNGKCTKGTDYNDRYLRVYIWKENSSGVWTTAWSLDINETYTVEKELTFTPSEEGEYHIEAYLYPQKGSDGKDYGTATLNFWRLEDNTQVAASYVYPTVIDTSAGYYIDGKEYTDNNTDLHCILTPGSSTEWQRHVITFKTKSSFVYTTDGENLLFRLFASPMTGQNVYLDICEPKLEEGMFATGFTDSAEDAKGISGCIQRVTEWASGIEFHNDEGLNSGTRFLDIAVVTESATSFKAYKCLKTHISSSSNAPQAGVTTEYWEPFNSMAPIYTPMIMAQYALLRLAQTNQLLVMKADGKTVNAAMGGGSIPLWVGATDGANAPFSVDENGKLHATGAEISGTINATDGTFKGKLNGVSGTFYKLSALDANGKEACTIYFSSDGHMTFEGDMYNQGYNNAQGRSYRFYTSDIMCRGLFGHKERYIAYVRGTYMTVYPKGTDKAGENVTLETQKLTDGTTCYKIPLYSPGTENSSGMPIDVVVFNTTADYYYLLTSWGNGKAVDLVNGNDSQNVHFCDQGGWHSFPGGASVHCVLINQKMFTNPVLSDSYPGLGVFWTGENDLNWKSRK